MTVILDRVQHIRESGPRHLNTHLVGRREAWVGVRMVHIEPRCTRYGVFLPTRAPVRGAWIARKYDVIGQPSICCTQHQYFGLGFGVRSPNDERDVISPSKARPVLNSAHVDARR